ncbi:MAG: lipoate--protein ligase [Sphaerochaetaceae bacterium]
MAKVRVFTAEHHNPWFNLATEEWLFDSFNEADHLLFLWRNSPCVVIGRFQNPWSECNLETMEKDGVLLARRQSGGGAVYHDLGNTNFTFMSKKELYDPKQNFAIITEALKEFGITALYSGRNDIIVDDKKVSGSAFRVTTKKAFHHGTLLIDAKLGSIMNYLTPDKEKLISKGVRSVASRVANLTQFNPTLNHENLSKALIETFFKTYKERCSIEDLTIERLSKESSLYETYKLYSDWQWRFGRTPNFSHLIANRFEWGRIELNLDVHSSIIKEVEIFSDALSVELINYLKDSLKNQKYDIKNLKHALLEGSSDKESTFKNQLNDVVSLIEKEFV